MTIDQDEVIRWNRSVTRQGNNLIRCKLATAVNRNVMEPRLRQSLLRSHVLEASVPNRDVVLPFSGFITGRYATHAIGLGGLILGLFMVLIWLAERVIRPCKPCISCGSPAATQTRLDTEDGPVCQTCLLLEIRRAFVDAKEQWFREQQRENERKRRRARARYISWFLPGVGHFLSGAPLRGALFSLMVIGGIIGGLELNIIITHPSAPLGPSSAKVAGCAVLGVGGWILAVLDAHTGGTGA